MAKKGKKETIDFIYKYTDGFKSFAVRGLFGGITPKGQIHIEFFNEYFTYPEKETHVINPDGTLGEKIGSENPKIRSIIREKVTGIIIDVDIAKSFHKWLGKRINEIDKITEEIEKTEDKSSDDS